MLLTILFFCLGIAIGSLISFFTTKKKKNRLPNAEEEGFYNVLNY